MSMSVAGELRDHLDTFDEHIRTLGIKKQLFLIVLKTFLSR